MRVNSKTRLLITDIFIISFGLLISSFGTALFYQAGLGSGAMATLSDGLHLILNISYGNANMLANVVLLIVLFICNKKMINIGTLMCVFMIGIFVDYGNVLFGIFNIASQDFLIRILCVFFGCLMMGAGLALYVATNRGFGALEGLVKHICFKKNLTFGKVKIAQDILLVVSGVLLGASFGIATIISTILVGPIMRFFIDLFEPMLGRKAYS